MHESVRMLADVIRPALVDAKLYSPTAELLLLGTIAQESNFKFLHQIDGPAIGLFQMEPVTHDDIWQHWLRFRPVWNARVRRWSIVGGVPGQARPKAEEMGWNLRYAAIMARLQYYRVPDPLPDVLDSNPIGLAYYWKNHYNTLAGAGTVQEFLDNFERYVK